MTQHLLKWATTSVAVLMVPHLVSGVEVSGFVTALCIAVVLGLLNLLVRPILFWLTLPITILSLGFFTLILNAMMFQLTDYFVNGFSVRSFSSAFWASLVVSVISWFLQLILGLPGGQARIHVRSFSSGKRRVRDLNS